MPAIHAKALLALVEANRLDDIRQSQIWRCEGCIATILIAEAPGAAEVIFGAGAADRGKVRIAVDAELDYALAPPAVITAVPGPVGADLVAPALCPVEQDMRFLVRQRVAAAPLGVQTNDSLRHVRQPLIELVEHGLYRSVKRFFNRDAGALAEWHFPVAVDGAVRRGRNWP